MLQCHWCSQASGHPLCHQDIHVHLPYAFSGLKGLCVCLITLVDQLFLNTFTEHQCHSTECFYSHFCCRVLQAYGHTVTVTEQLTRSVHLPVILVCHLNIFSLVSSSGPAGHVGTALNQDVTM